MFCLSLKWLVRYHHNEKFLQYIYLFFRSTVSSTDPASRPLFTGCWFGAKRIQLAVKPHCSHPLPQTMKETSSRERATFLGWDVVNASTKKHKKSHLKWCTDQSCSLFMLTSNVQSDQLACCRKQGTDSKTNSDGRQRKSRSKLLSKSSIGTLVRQKKEKNNSISRYIHKKKRGLSQNNFKLQMYDEKQLAYTIWLISQTDLF